jgi:uncharacterized membrane protein
MDGWTLIRLLHVLALAFFVGGQLVLVTAVVPAVRRHDASVAMRTVARRFGVGSALSLIFLIATGIAMASRTDRWSDSALQVKLVLLVVAAVLTALHIVTPSSRGVPIALLAVSLVIVWFGVELSHG